MSDEQAGKRNWRRRGGCAVVCIFPFALAIASIIFGAMRGPVMYPYGLYVVLFAAVIGVLNFCLAWVPPFAPGSSEGFVSGIPVVGTLIVTVGLLLSFGHIGTALIGLLVLLTDIGGFPWFVAMTWRDRGLWDEAPLH